jgi:hypothetical protein
VTALMRQACAMATVLGALVARDLRAGAAERFVAASPGARVGARRSATPASHGGAPDSSATPSPTPRAPIELPAPAAPHHEAHASAAEAPSPASIRASVARAAAFLARFPEADLRFDAALMLSQIRRVFDSDDLRAAFARAREIADRDEDNPMRRFWIPELRSPVEHTSTWAVPAAGEKRVNTNRVIIEALHCAENGLREETVAYLCGPMRDGGGYQSTHALWALELARSAGCDAALRAAACRASLQEEILAAARQPVAAQRTRDLDLFAERVMVLTLSGVSPESLARHMARLVALQSADGSWSKPEPGEAPYFAYHATGLGAWALAEWTRRSEDAAHPRPTKPHPGPP